MALAKALNMATKASILYILWTGLGILQQTYTAHASLPCQLTASLANHN